MPFKRKENGGQLSFYFLVPAFQEFGPLPSSSYLSLGILFQLCLLSKEVRELPSTEI
jgi:hypothetical protein